MNNSRINTVLDYHVRSKHSLSAYAAGPETLDWDAQPAAFREWVGTRQFALPRDITVSDITWNALAVPRAAVPFDTASLGSMLRLCVGLSAWKQYAGVRWSLRVHPSSGNLHPTETWLIAAGVNGLDDGLYHYHNLSHALERRAWGNSAKRNRPLKNVMSEAETRKKGAKKRSLQVVNEHFEPLFDAVSTSAIVFQPPACGVWLGFSSIHWREAWKYGERAFRYCQLDMGHVLASVCYAAALHGWRPRLMNMDAAAVARSLALDCEEEFSGVEVEEPEVIVALDATSTRCPISWQDREGKPSLLDPHPLYQWPIIEEVAQATRGAPPLFEKSAGHHDPVQNSDAEMPAASLILQRRSAQAFDGQSIMPTEVFKQLLSGLLPGGSPVWDFWPYTARVHPVLLVHRVDGMAPGLYVLPRSESAHHALKHTLRATFNWQKADVDLPLYQMVAAQAVKTARKLSCHQDIASHSAVTFMMLAEFAEPIAADPVAYRHLHWEAGMLGHVITLAAEAAGWRGTGIGCFFDDADHEVLGLQDNRFQVIYHYAVGMPLDDPRISTLPAYE